MPTLTVHGTDDETVPVSTSERLRDEQPDLVTYESFDGAGHAACWNSDPDRYDALLADFLSDICGRSGLRRRRAVAGTACPGSC